MSNRYELIIPSKTRSGEFLNTKIAKKLVADKMIDLFGGVTLTKGDGYYRSTSGKLMKEHITTAVSYTSADSVEEVYLNEKEMRLLAVHVRDILDQESVALVINNKLELI